MIRYRWNTIESQINEAIKHGSLTVELPTEQDAKNYAYAIYNFRRKRGLGREIRLSLSEKFVTIFKPVEMVIKTTTSTPITNHVSSTTPLEEH